MRTNINNNIIPNNYFIRRKKPIYIDSTSNVYIKKFGSDCNNLEIVNSNDPNISNHNLKDIELTEKEDIEINGVIFNSETNYIGNIKPTHIFPTGLWKTINDNYSSSTINDVLVDYPIKLVYPNIIHVSEENYSVTFIIQDMTIFNDNDVFNVSLISINNSKKNFNIKTDIIFNSNTSKYTVNFNKSVFVNKTVNNNYYIALKFNGKVYLSDPTRYMYITNNKNLKTLEFNSNKNKLNYVTTPNSDLILNYHLSGLETDSTYRLKINDFYYSPVLTYKNSDNIQTISIPNKINIYNVEIETDHGTIMDISSDINVEIDYKYRINILNSNLNSNNSLNICFDKKFINNIVNISLENYFIKNDIITSDNYLNYTLPIELNEVFDDGRYRIRVQILNSELCGISDEYININNIDNLSYNIIPNFGYNNVPFSYNNKYNPITNNGEYVCPYGVKSIDINMINNNRCISGQIILIANSIIKLTNNSLLINNRELINFETNNFVENRINNFSNTYSDLPNNNTINYVCEDCYIIQLQNWDSSIKNIDIYNNWGFDKNYNIYYSSVYGYHIKLFNTFFNFIGELEYYWMNDNKLTYINKIKIRDYPFNIGLNLLSKNVYINQPTMGSIVINKVPPNNSYTLYFVDDLLGTNPEYLTTTSNLNFSFTYINRNQTECIKYLMITSNVINKVINNPINIKPSENLSNKLKQLLEKKSKLNSPKLMATAPQPIIGVYTTYDTPPNKTTPSYFLENNGLYKYNNVPTLLGSEYSNFNGYLILQSDPLSNSIPQTSTTLDNFTDYLIGNLANKKISLINVPSIFQDQYVGDDFITTNHTFEYYNNTILNNEQINIQASLCSNVIQNDKLITDITLIKNNFLQSYNNQIRNYTGQNSLNEQITQLTSITNNSPRFAWIENLGHYISQYFQLNINNVEIEKVTSSWINNWNEINLDVGKRSGYNKMIGNVPSLTSYNTNKIPKYKLRIPIPFYFNRYNAGLSIPMISLVHSDVKLTLQMEKLENLIISDPLTKFSTSNRPKLNLELKYIYLDEDERKRFATSKHEYLIEQENYRNYTFTGTKFNTKLNFLQPVKDLYWYAQPITNTNNISNRQYWNYTNSKYYKLLSNYDRYDEDNPITELSRQLYTPIYNKYPDLAYIPLYINGKINESNRPYQTKSPINNTVLRLNGQKRFDEDSGLTQLKNFYRYKNIPENGMHTYPFCLYPNEYQPSGSCNFSVLGDTYFELDLDNGAYNIEIIARNYNLLRIMSGQAGLGYEL